MFTILFILSVIFNWTLIITIPLGVLAVIEWFD